MKKKELTLKLMISELHRAFDLFNKDLFNNELPTPAILIQSKGNKKNVLGWFSVNTTWINSETKEEKHEINLVAEYVNRGVYPVLATLLHEMIHFYCSQNELKDTSRSGTYHNDKFKAVAESHGLVCEHDKRIGWSLTKLQPFVMDLIDSNGFKEEDFTLGRKDFGAGEKEKKKKKSSVKKYVCPKCGQIARATNDKALLICGKCYIESEGAEVLLMQMEQPEDAEGTEGTIEPTEGTEGTESPAPAVEPLKVVIAGEHVCKSCGALHYFDKGEILVCSDCGGDEFVYTEGTHEEPTAPAPVEFVEPEIIDTEESLDDGAGNPVDVIQPVIIPADKVKIIDEPDETNILAPEGTEVIINLMPPIENTLLRQLGNKYRVPVGVEPLEYWTVRKINEVMCDISEYMHFIGEQRLNANSYTGAKINKRKAKNLGTCFYKQDKKGRGVNHSFSIELRAHFLAEACDVEILDTIIHEFIHGWLYVVTKKSHGHNDLFKRWCTKLGIKATATKEVAKR